MNIEEKPPVASFVQITKADYTIYSGRFQGTMVGGLNASPDSVYITEGFFDINVETLSDD